MHERRMLLHLFLVTSTWLDVAYSACPRVRRLQIQAPVLDYCPCVKPPGSLECLSYDNRLQATSLDEALHTFRDLSAPYADSEPLVTSSTSAIDDDRPQYTTDGIRVLKTSFSFAAAPRKLLPDYTCVSDVCRACKQLLMHAFTQAANPSDRLIAPSDLDQSLCPKVKPYGNANDKAGDGGDDLTLNGTSQDGAPLPAYLREVASLLTRRQIRERRNTVDRNASAAQSCGRCPTKRPPLLGVATTISCNYKKGDEIANGWSGLCNLCWQWRKLPPNYFPILLNEVACDTSDEGCLAGFGNCQPIMRSINVLRKASTDRAPRWIQESINTIAACECQVELGTPLHALVVRRAI